MSLEDPSKKSPEVTTLKEAKYPTHLSRKLLEDLVAGIPDSLLEGRPETPIKNLDLWADGFGEVMIKDESRQDSNPTGTMKDRMALACARQFKKWIESYLTDLRYRGPYGESQLAETKLQRHSILTAGNAGLALAEAFARFNLPYPKLLMDSHLTPSERRVLKDVPADIYLVDLSYNPFTGKPSVEDPLKPEQILQLTNNDTYQAVEITSSGMGYEAYFVRGMGRQGELAPVFEFYKDLAADIFTRQPNEIYVPYGSGVLFENLINYQTDLSIIRRRRFARNPSKYIEQAAKKSPSPLAKIKIFGAEPTVFPSIADKLAAPVKPFRHYSEGELDSFKKIEHIASESGVYRVSEEEIKEAYELLKKRGEPLGIETEPSAAAGLALYMKRWRQGLRDKDQKVIIVNTGHGLFTKRTNNKNSVSRAAGASVGAR